MQMPKDRITGLPKERGDHEKRSDLLSMRGIDAKEFDL